MNKRKILTLLVTALVSVGGAILFYSFLLGMQPTEKSDAGLPRLDMSSTKIGTFEIMKAEPYSAYHIDWEISYAVLKFKDGKIRVWKIPTKNSLVGMPDIHWWRPSYECENFGPILIDGIVDESSTIECRDSTVPSEWWAKAWRWDLNGNAIGVEGIDDLELAKGTLHGEYYVLGKSS